MLWKQHRSSQVNFMQWEYKSVCVCVFMFMCVYVHTLCMLPLSEHGQSAGITQTPSVFR